LIQRPIITDTIGEGTPLLDYVPVVGLCLENVKANNTESFSLKF
jgi:hypothetical protein